MQLAVDGANNVYAADTSNARVVRIYNPQAAVMEGKGTVGSGFTKPTAVAVDNSGNLFVADGSNLVEVTTWGGQTSITSSLVPPVTGLAVDPSGSVYVAQSGGILRIPMTSSGLNANNAASIDNTSVTAPTGLGLDALGNLYVTANSYSVTTINTSGTPLGPVTNTVNTPNVLMLANAALNFGIVDTATTTDPIDISVFNIGNAPLMFSATTPPSFSGTNASDYAIEQDGQNPCDVSGATSIDAGTACTLGVTVTAANNGLSQASMSFATTAINAPTSSATLEAYSENNLCRTSTAITLNPSTGVVYPGSTSVAATVAALDPTCSPGNTPTGGKISLTLAPQTKGAAQIVLNSTVSSGKASFNATALNGGTYNVYASYKGDPIFGGSSSSKTYTFTVAQAASTAALSTPTGVSPINGVYYVLKGSSTTMTATVTSKQGTPTGSVTFMNGSTVARHLGAQREWHGDLQHLEPRSRFLVSEPRPGLQHHCGLQRRSQLRHHHITGFANRDRSGQRTDYRRATDPDDEGGHTGAEHAHHHSARRLRAEDRSAALLRQHHAAAVCRVHL